MRTSLTLLGLVLLASAPASVADPPAHAVAQRWADAVAETHGVELDGATREAIGRAAQALTTPQDGGPFQAHHVGEVWSLNFGAATSPAGALDAGMCVGPRVPQLDHIQWTGGPPIVDVPRGFHFSFTEWNHRLSEGGLAHEGGRHVGTTCIIESTPLFSWVVSSGAFVVSG